jgi:hypothetical protein
VDVPVFPENSCDPESRRPNDEEAYDEKKASRRSVADFAA